jgi:hypothetical protein
MRKLSWVLLAAIVARPAWSARPLITDDARIAEARSCQLETWVRLNRTSHEMWALPACNLTGNFELTAGGGYAFDLPTGNTADYVLQGKTILREATAEQTGVGLAFGLVAHPDINPGPNQLGNTYAYLPVSVPIVGERWMVHVNLGWRRDRASQRNNATWGVATEAFLVPSLSLVAEAFGNTRDNVFWQTGFRYFIVLRRVQLDATIGAQHNEGREGRWISIGLRITAGQLF